jgi:hypothetical protein
MDHADNRMFVCVTRNWRDVDFTAIECLFDELTDYDETIIQQEIVLIKQLRRQCLKALFFVVPFMTLISPLFGLGEMKARWAANKALVALLRKPIKELTGGKYEVYLQG